LVKLEENYMAPTYELFTNPYADYPLPLEIVTTIKEKMKEFTLKPINSGGE